MISNHAEISRYMFRLHLLDLKRLRNKYRVANEEVPHGVLMAAKRHHIVEILARHEFGSKTIDEYKKLCKQWDKDEKFVLDNQIKNYE